MRVNFRFGTARGRGGMALVLTLAILAILSILLVAFVSSAALDRGATESYAKSLQADQLAQGRLDSVVAQFRGEIADSSLSLNETSGSQLPLYIPINATNAVPQRSTANAAGLATLIAYSGSTLYTGAAPASNYASPSSTLNSSLNGRIISTTRWNKPQLMTNTANFPTPQWILVTRAGPQAFASYTSTLANDSPLNSSNVVGRYAYTVYDTSGLIDVNAAGYPSTAAASAAGKGLIPWADLTQLSSAVSQADVDQLVGWRNAYSTNNYAAYVSSAATNNGFTVVANGDTCFLGRQELIQYAQTQNPDLTNALPYLTTFSRELNGPTWGPTTPAGSTINYASAQYTAGSFNPRIPNPRVQTSFTRDNGLTAVVGEPLVKYRFPLDKLALLESVGTTYTTAQYLANKNNIQTQIQEYFGLDMGTNSAGVPDGNGPSFRHWSYPTTNSLYKHGVLSGTTGIMSLDDVAAQNREPDFFELLQAGMLSGSLGTPGNGNKGRSDQSPANPNGYASFQDPDDKATLQIMRIGANIIDQWDADSFPTTITYNYQNGGVPTYVNVEGIEDLPYPFAAYLNFYAPNQGLTGGTYTTPLNPFEFFLYFELWNPHQMPASPVAANYPTLFRFNPYYNSSLPSISDSFVAGFQNSRATNSSGAQVSASWFYYGPGYNNAKNGPANGHNPFYLANLAPSGIPFSYSPSTAATDYREPTLAVPGTPAVVGPSPWNNIACLALPQLTNFPAVNAVANQGSAVGFPGANTPPSAWQCQYYFHMVMPVQYQDAGGLWHTYSTFLGLDDPAGAFAAGTGFIAPGNGTTVNFPTASLSCPMLIKADPRTCRFGVSDASATPDYNVPLATNGGMVTPITALAPFGASAPYRLDLLAANDGTVNNPPNPYYADVDGVERWGDAHHSSPSGSPLFTGNPPGATPANTANLPLILNRPFQSVGELGYAYRDMPWKSVDLFSANSADSALLDLFTLNDAPMLAGRVNPNTPYPRVLAALLSGANMSTSAGTLTPANASTIANAITSITAGVPPSPFVNRADMVNDFMTNSAISNISAIKTEEEAAVRAVAESANTRTWNFLIDIVAQSGRYPTSATSLDNFVVEGERRYWLHVAIDRYTGQVVDKQLEVVNE